MEQSKPAIEPYVASEKTVAETTVLALGLGAALAVVMGAANTYLGLYAGMTVSASIPAAVISMAILRGVFRRGTILENNITQTMASTGESLAAGAIFTVPALVIVGQWQEFQFWPTTAIVMLGGVLGVIFMVPMRRALIVGRTDLVYPEGVACSEVLIVGQEGGSGIKSIALGLGVGAVFKFLITGLHWLREAIEGAFILNERAFYFGANASAALVAVGYIVNLQIASLVFLGGVIGWVIAIPLLGGAGGDREAIEVAGELWSTQVRYIGVGAMLVGGVHSIWHVRHGIVAGVTGLRGAAAAFEGGHLRTERDLPLTALLTIFLFATVGTFFFYDFLIGNMGIAAVAAAIMILAAFLFVAVATYIVGLVGSSNSPVSGMTICAVLIAAGILLALGVRGDSAILATLGVAGVVCCATCTSGDIAQDLKTGQLVGATPRNLQWTELVAVLVSSFFFAPILTLLHNNYGIGTLDGLPAPQATLFASLAEGFFGEGEIPRDMVFIGGAVGVALLVINYGLEKAQSPFRAHVMPVAVGIYLPLALSVPIFIGGLIRAFVERGRSRQPGAFDTGLLFGSGLIAGEALMGILIAIPIALQDQLGFTMPTGPGNFPLTVVSFAALLAGYTWIARQRSNS